jgi:glucose/mannose transport system permease protein
VRGGFINSFRIVVPTVMIAVTLGAINGYVLAFWRSRFAEIIFTILLIGAFIPLQVYIFPMVRLTTGLGIFGTLPGVILVHVCMSLPLNTLLYRNYFVAMPKELFNAARVDGAGFWSIFFVVMLPVSAPITIVAVILQATGAWNDYVLGLVFAGRENVPITVLLNTLLSSGYGDVKYNVNMAATIITGLVPLVIYFVSGRWFVRGITDGAMKG